MTCIYHSKDFDGICSGKILQNRFPYATMIPYDYGQPIPNINTKEDVIMSDVTFPLDDIIRLAEQCNQNGTTFTVIDHHVSFADKVETLEHVPFKFIYKNGTAACKLTWFYCFPTTPCPPAVELLAKYDVWKQESDWEVAVLPFQYGLRVISNDLGNFPVWVIGASSYAADKIYETISIGKSILCYEFITNQKYCAEYSFEFIFKDLNAICLNHPGANSGLFKSVWDEKKYDVMICFRYSGVLQKWIYSLYTTKDIDCAEICKSLGGGGHKQAAGFSSRDFLLR